MPYSTTSHSASRSTADKCAQHRKTSLLPKRESAKAKKSYLTNKWCSVLSKKLTQWHKMKKWDPGTFGAIQSEATVRRLQRAAELECKILRNAEPCPQPGFENARSYSPFIAEVPMVRPDIYESEWFGPITFIIPVQSFEQALEQVYKSRQNQWCAHNVGLYHRRRQNVSSRRINHHGGCARCIQLHRSDMGQSKCSIFRFPRRRS
jgi:hypothetical protein